MKEPKYFELHAKTTLNISGLISPELKPVEPPKGGIFIVSGGEVSFKEIEKPADTRK
jgi:hypothetical protein